jgi:glutamine synthetase
MRENKMTFSYTSEETNKAKKFITDNAIKYIQLGYIDTNGALLGKQIRTRRFWDGFEGGTGFCAGTLTWDAESNYFAEAGMAGFDRGALDAFLYPDFNTIRVLPWKKDTALILSDVMDYDKSPYPIYARNILKHALTDCEREDYVVKIGAEIEFYLLGADKKPLFGGRETYSLRRQNAYSGILDKLQDTLEELGIELESLHLEYGPAQVELILKHTDPLAIADRLALARNAVQIIARESGCDATFMAQPWENESGSGIHLHQSLWRNGENLFAKDSALLEKYVSGLLALTPEFAAVHNPTVNAYKRLAAKGFVPSKICAGYDNRTVLARIVNAAGGARVEYRLSSANANPYLIVAANVVSGLYGIKNDLPETTKISDDAHKHTELPDIPRAPDRAADLFDAGATVEKHFGAEFKRVFLELLRFDIAENLKFVSDRERERYL